MQYRSKIFESGFSNKTIKEVLLMGDTVDEMISMLEERIKDYRRTIQILREFKGRVAPSETTSPSAKKPTIREAIVGLQTEAEEPMSAERIKDGLALADKPTTLTTVRSALSRGKADGVFINDTRGWTLLKKGE